MTNDKPVFWVGGRAQDGQGNDVDVPEATEQVSAAADAQADAAELATLRDQIAALTAERDQLQAALEDLQTAPAGLPADAHARLVGVKGVGEKLADEIMAALTAPAQAE